MIECETVIDINVQKILTKIAYTCSIVALVIGTLGLIAYLVLGTIINELWTEFFLIFALPFGIGLVYTITLNKNYKIFKNTVMVNCYAFGDVALTVTTIKNNENIGSSTIPYSTIYKTKEIDKYIFIFLNKNSAFPIDKSRLTDEQIKEIKTLLIKP